MKMDSRVLLCYLMVSSTGWLLVYTHMLIQDRLSCTSESGVDVLQERTHSTPPPVLIVELSKNVKRNKTRTEKKARKQNKFSVKSKRPPPPANCVPLWGSCKTPDAMCCDYCAYCQCRLFKTVCFCRMGYPRC
ncbi:agouti signaling protein 1 [Denticeps clupeoides]|uniref:Agouti-signaling protein n=1 Tax=Denticeps clupeoides TaxID=299321 RepID=A0AAY4E1R2_9TELE|nr:agouti-signaling protein-like [Denticeps clupeoides]